MGEPRAYCINSVIQNFDTGVKRYGEKILRPRGTIESNNALRLSIRLDTMLFSISFAHLLQQGAKMPTSQSPLRFDVEVPSDGRIEVQVPLPAGSHVTVFVVEQAGDGFDDLLAAAASSTDFWNNPADDDEWGDA